MVQDNGDKPTREAYLQQLIEKGLDPGMAQEVVSQLAEAGQLREEAASDRTSHTNEVMEGDSPKPSRLALLAASRRISMTGPAGNDLAFMHTILCQVGLPRRAIEGTSFQRVCDGVGIHIQAGSLFDGEGWVEHPVPYGAMPRLVLAHLNTQALRQRSPIVDVGPSASAFLRTLGFEPAGGDRGPYTMFKRQVQALAACRITMGYSVGDTAYTVKGDLIDEFEAWTRPNGQGAGRDLWPEKIAFTQRYYDSLTQHAVPLDLRALHALKGSALALDLYAMLAERLHRVSGKSVLLHWASLRAQFGHDYHGEHGPRNFKRDFKVALKKVLAVYPKARVSVVKTGIALRPSPPPIPYRG